MLSKSMRVAFAGGVAIGASLLAQSAMAQEAAMQRVEITGSSIKRITQEGALPVQTLTRKDIDQTGVTNVADLIATLPSMQGFLTASASVNGGGTGVQSASVHSIGTAYTLVLLNGRRMAPYGTGSAVNLASIPLSAVDRVEILTDGASTLYGSDAIAGVVNFILKKNTTDLTFDASYNAPQKSGGESSTVSITKGFGDLNKDGFNVMLSYAHDEQRVLKASQRDFAKSGVRAFEEGGKKYTIFQTSANSIPANVAITSKDGSVDEFFAPELAAGGKCTGPNTFERGGVCRFDFAATVDLIPELKRDSLFASGNWKLNDTSSLFFEAVYSKFSNSAVYAAPAQPLTVISNNGATVDPNYIVPFTKTIVPLLAKYGTSLNDLSDATFNFRAFDAGGRGDAYNTEAKHFVIGGDTSFAGWDMGANFTHSENTQTDDAISGYMSANKFDALLKDGKYNPFVNTAGAAALLAPAVLRENLSTTTSKIDVLSARGSREVFDMGGGKASLGLGADATRQHYVDSPSQIAQGPGPQHPSFTDVIIGGGTGALPLDAKRSSWGAFGEILMPVMKNLDVTAAMRYDSYDRVKKSNVSYDTTGKAFTPGDLGESGSKATYKLSARFQPTKEWLLRGSYGTGFKAPTMNDIADPLQNFGSSNFFPCPITSNTDARFKFCNPGSSEYSLLSSGNPATGANALKPEESKQATFGFRVEPMTSLSLGLDFWDVKLKNQIQPLSQDQIFTIPALANQYIVVYFDPIQKANVLAAPLTPVNLANSHFQGLDFDATYKTNTPIGKLNINWSGTYMLKAEQDIPSVGTESSLGRFDSYDKATARLISRMVGTLKQSEMLTHGLTYTYRSGYVDKPITAGDSALRVINADGSIGATTGLVRKVKSYSTFDYQLKAFLSKEFTLTAGIKNLLDTDPPLSIRNSGGGNQIGYDGRYTDPIGRMYYLAGSYKF